MVDFGENIVGGHRGGGHPSLLNKTLARADRFYEQGDITAARDYLILAANLQPKSVEIISSLGALDYLLGDYRSAVREFTRAARLSPCNAMLQTQLAATWLQLGRTREFESSLQCALDVDPTHSGAAKLRAAQMLAGRRYYEAAQWYYRVIERAPADLESLLALAKCFYELGDYETAHTAFKRVLDFDAANPLAQEGVAVIASLVPALQDPPPDDDTLSFPA